jgi:hypothetical protein
LKSKSSSSLPVTPGVYFEMRRGMYSLSQAGIFANNLLQDRIAKFAYYKAATTLGLWHHKWHPVTFALIVDNFTIQYLGNAHGSSLPGSQTALQSL